MAIHLRQIALVGHNLAAAIGDLNAVFGLHNSYIDEAVAQWGLENTLLAVGTDFIEVVAPTKPGTSAGRYLERRQGDGGYMVICQADSAATQAEVMARAEQQQVRVAFEREAPEWHIVQFHPGDMRASFLEVDSDQINDFTGNWHPAGGLGWEGTVDTATTLGIQGVELQGPDPRALAQHWSQVLGIDALDMDAEPYIPLANAKIRFVTDTDGRGPGLSGVDLRVHDPVAVRQAAEARNCRTHDDAVEVCGTRFYLS